MYRLDLLSNRIGRLFFYNYGADAVQLPSYYNENDLEWSYCNFGEISNADQPVTSLYDKCSKSFYVFM